MTLNSLFIQDEWTGLIICIAPQHTQNGKSVSLKKKKKEVLGGPGASGEREEDDDGDVSQVFQPLCKERYGILCVKTAAHARHALTNNLPICPRPAKRNEKKTNIPPAGSFMKFPSSSFRRQIIMKRTKLDLSWKKSFWDERGNFQTQDSSQLARYSGKFEILDVSMTRWQMVKRWTR